MTRRFRAPGRVNLIGEHTDYNDGFVLPAAIEFSTFATASPRTDQIVHVESRHYKEYFEFSLEDRAATPRQSWTDYIQGVALALLAEGVELRGANLTIESDIPIGAGLSSSAALEVSSGLALTVMSRTEITKILLAHVCQRAENDFVGMRCGIMDQFVSVHGKEGHAILLDCRSLEYQAVPLPSTIRLVICNTMVKHELASSEYNERRRACEEAARQLGVASLRELPYEAFLRSAEDLPVKIRLRAQHVVAEIERTERAADVLVAGDLKLFGRYMNESHESLRDSYEVSCEELDLMVQLAQRQPGVYGARMTGGGFGGCTINLVAVESVPEFRDKVSRGYREATGIAPHIYVCCAVDGAQEVVS